MPAYTPQTWADNDATKPVSAARMGVIETGIDHASVPTKSTTLPGSPFDGQETYFEASSGSGVYWHLRYRSASASGFKWEFLGGPSLFNEVGATAETTASSTYVSLSTVGPSITLPLAGDYELDWGALIKSSVADAFARMSLTLGSTAANDNWQAVNANTSVASCQRKYLATGLAASDVVVAKYRNASGTGTFQNRWLAVRPVRVG